MFETVVEAFCRHVPKDHVVLVHLPTTFQCFQYLFSVLQKRIKEDKCFYYVPNIAVLVGEDAQEELALAVGDSRLRHDDVIARREREERHHFPGHRVVRHIQRFLYTTNHRSVLQ